MIEITKYEERHHSMLSKMMLQENLDFNEISLCLDTLYIVVERGQALGFGYFNAYDDKIYIDNLYIKKSERMNKLGDSLFRAILNALNLVFLKNVYMRNSDLYRGFLKAEDIEYDKNTDEFVITLPDFFNRKCRGSKMIEGTLN